MMTNLRNTICGQPLEFGNHRQVQLIQRLKELEPVELLPWENNIWHCPRCNKKNFVRVHCCQDGYARIVTPRNYHCTRCDMIALHFRFDPYQDYEFEYEYHQCTNGRPVIAWSWKPMDELDYIHYLDPIRYYRKLMSKSQQERMKDSRDLSEWEWYF